MNNYEDSKKVRRIASVIYLLIMAVILGGTYLSQQQKESEKKALQESSIPLETTVVYSDPQVRD
jgi:hypothetical protein